jgi:flavin reductase (DIM6/NTAB) family NADH-FMN oxidoreductase RutF
MHDIISKSIYPLRRIGMREKVASFDAFEQTMEQMEKQGLLLVSGEKGNPMAIGWGTVGIIWGKPMFIVLVRPSRYSFHFMESTQEFTVNVLPDSYGEKVAFCGSKSGRDINKIEACGFTLEKGILINVPFIGEAFLHYECRTVHKNNVINADLDMSIVNEYYPEGDFHRVYFGEILGVYRQ